MCMYGQVVLSQYDKHVRIVTNRSKLKRKHRLKSMRFNQKLN